MKIHHVVSEKSNDKLFFIENAITEDEMTLRTSALAHFIQNKLYLQYILQGAHQGCGSWIFLLLQETLPFNK